MPSGIVVGDLLYLVNDMQSILTVYEANTGALVYQGRMGVAQREGFSASPVAVNGKVFFTNDEGQTFVVQAGREFKLLHVNELGARTLASPALVDGTWYWRSDGIGGHSLMTNVKCDAGDRSDELLIARSIDRSTVHQIARSDHQLTTSRDHQIYLASNVTSAVLPAITVTVCVVAFSASCQTRSW